MATWVHLVYLVILLFEFFVAKLTDFFISVSMINAENQLFESIKMIQNLNEDY